MALYSLRGTTWEHIFCFGQFVVVQTELQRGRGRRDEKEKLGMCNLQLVCPSHVDLALVPCLLEGERVARRGRGGLQCRGRGCGQRR